MKKVSFKAKCGQGVPFGGSLQILPGQEMWSVQQSVEVLERGFKCSRFPQSLNMDKALICTPYIPDGYVAPVALGVLGYDRLELEWPIKVS